MLDIGAPELIVILVIVMLVFGVGKLPEVGGALGKGIREFRHASSATFEEEAPASPAAVLPPLEWTCSSCETRNPVRQAFCGSCGAAKASPIAAEA